MKLVWMTSLFLLMSGIASAEALCPNNGATALLSSQGARELISLVATIDSMPLSGTIVAETDDGSAQVLVSVQKDYAGKFGIDSFDVAKKLLLLSAGYPSWGVSSISAYVCLGDDATSNAGTIGHRATR